MSAAPPLLVALALAASSGEAPPTPAASASLSRIAATLADAIAAAAPPGTLAVHVTGTTPALAVATTTLVLGALAARGRPAAPIDALTAAVAEQRARQAGVRSLARVQVGVFGGAVVATGDLLGTRVNFWAGRAGTRPATPAAALAASAPADASVLALAAAGPGRPAATAPLSLTGAAFAALPSPPAALAVGDLTGDGLPEVVALTDDQVVAFTAAGQPLASFDHRRLALSPAPCREPFGALTVSGATRRIAFFSARRAQPMSLALDAPRRSLVTAGELTEATLVDAPWGTIRARPVPGQSAFAPPLLLPRAVRGVPDRPVSFVSASGQSLLLVHPDGSASLGGRDAARPIATGVGASALADLDADGAPELIATPAAFEPEVDTIAVVSGVETLAAPIQPFAGEASATDGPTTAWRGAPLRGRVLAVTAGDLDGDGADELVIGVALPGGGGELQVFRRTP